MDRVKLIKKGEITIDKLIKKIKHHEKISECGAIISFIGITRGIGHNGAVVKKMEYQADEELAVKSLQDIRERILKKYPDVRDLFIYHVIDTLNVGEDILYVIAISGHREEGFAAIQDAIDILKEETPIWKKEYTEKGKYWVSEKGLYPSYSNE
ncbi:MAG: molybdenum cofactor biosynthesis protein MoaE [Candidatus Asgardarchaeia archaeon]